VEDEEENCIVDSELRSTASISAAGGIAAASDRRKRRAFEGSSSVAACVIDLSGGGSEEVCYSGGLHPNGRGRQQLPYAAVLLPPVTVAEGAYRLRSASAADPASGTVGAAEAEAAGATWYNAAAVRKLFELARLEGQRGLPGDATVTLQRLRGAYVHLARFLPGTTDTSHPDWYKAEFIEEQLWKSCLDAGIRVRMPAG